MVTRYRNPSDHDDMIETDATDLRQGEYVRYEDYCTLQRTIALKDSAYQKAIEALKPFADKWLYPDDLIADGFDIVDADYSQAANDDTLDECWIKRGWIRAARLVLGKE